MRCFACDSELTDYEATLKSLVTGEYLDLCVSCISAAEISTAYHKEKETSDDIPAE